MQDPPTLAESVLVTARLSELGISEQVLREAVFAGLRFSFACTKHDPPNAAGFIGWAKIVREIRDRLAPLGWAIDNSNNFALTIHPEQGWALIVAGGDAATGTDATPSTRSAKGPYTRSAVTVNQLSFVDVHPAFAGKVSPQERTHTWLLLHYFDEERNEIRVELSLPDSMSDDDFVEDWRERIILQSIPLDTPPVPLEDLDDEVIDVPVERRKT